MLTIIGMFLRLQGVMMGLIDKVDLIVQDGYLLGLFPVNGTLLMRTFWMTHQLLVIYNLDHHMV